jgi:glycosyltransferase involved in cell wall biosynthesis
VPSAPVSGWTPDRMNTRPLKLAIMMTTLDDLGVQRVVLNLYKHFDRSRVDPTLVLWHRSGRFEPFLPKNAAVHETDPGLPWPRFVFRLPHYLRILRELKPDVILSCVPATNLSIAMLKPLLSDSPALVACEHAFLTRAFALGEYTGAFRWLYQPLIRPMYNNIFGRLVMTAESGREDAVTNWHIDRDKIEIIYNPQDLSELRVRAAEDIDDPWFSGSSIPTFVAAARLVEQKGFDLLIEAFARLQKERDARLVILGRGPLEDQLKQQAGAAGLDQAVRFLGFQINHLKYIKRATAFVLSSRWEAMPMVVGETMAIGTPIVSFDCPSGPRELLDDGQCGFLVPDQDVGALAKMLAHVIDHPDEAASKVKKALDRAELLDVGRITRQYETLLESEARRRRAT